MLLDAGSGDVDPGSGDPDDDGSGDVLPEPVGGFSQMRVIQYSADNKKTTPFFEAAVTEIISEYLKNSEDSTELVTVKVDNIVSDVDDIVVLFSVEVGHNLWTRSKTDATLFDKQSQFETVFGNTMIIIPRDDIIPSADQLNKMIFKGASDMRNMQAFKEIIAEALNIGQEVVFSLKVPYHADNVIIKSETDNYIDDDSEYTVEYFVLLANGEVTPPAKVYAAVKGKESQIADSVGVSDVSIIDPSVGPSGPSSNLPTWAIAAIVVGGLVGLSVIAVVSSLLIKKRKRSTGKYSLTQRYLEHAFSLDASDFENMRMNRNASTDNLITFQKKYPFKYQLHNSI